MAFLLKIVFVLKDSYTLKQSLHSVSSAHDLDLSWKMSIAEGRHKFIIWIMLAFHIIAWPNSNSINVHSYMYVYLLPSTKIKLTLSFAPLKLL